MGRKLLKSIRNAVKEKSQIYQEQSQSASSSNKLRRFRNTSTRVVDMAGTISDVSGIQEDSSRKSHKQVR